MMKQKKSEISFIYKAMSNMLICLHARMQFHSVNEQSYGVKVVEMTLCFLLVQWHRVENEEDDTVRYFTLLFSL